MHLEAALGSRTRVKILRTLFQEAFPQLDADALVDETGKSRSGVHKALNEIVATGLVRETRRGRTHYYAVDRGHPWARRLAELFRAERTQDNVPHLFPTYWNRLEDLARDLSRRDGVLLVLLFGSLTRNPVEPTADVDLLVGLDADAEPPSAEEQLLGHEVSLTGMALDRFLEKLEAGDAFAASVAERNVVLYRDPGAETVRRVDKLLGLPGGRAARGP